MLNEQKMKQNKNQMLQITYCTKKILKGEEYLVCSFTCEFFIYSPDLLVNFTEHLVYIVL